MVSKPRISFDDSGKVLSLSEEGYKFTVTRRLAWSLHDPTRIGQLNSGLKSFLVMSPGFVCIGVMEEWE